LTDTDHAWREMASELRQVVPPLPPAYRRALEAVAQLVPATTQQRANFHNSVTRPTMTACIHVERMMHRNSIAVLGETAASYCLVKLIPSGEGAAGKVLGLNLALVLDLSGSMYEEDGTGMARLKRVQNAAKSAIQELKPTDSLAVIGFAYNALVLLPSTALSDKNKINDVIDKVDMFDVDPGGTAMDQGIQLGMDEVKKQPQGGRLSQVVVLTDGETSGEAVCRQLAQKAANEKMHLSLMGVGTEWNASLIKDLARLSNGKWYYIDVNEANAADEVFKREFGSLAAAGFLNVEMRVRPIKDVRIKRLRQVSPEIKLIELKEAEASQLVGQLGTLERDRPTKYVIDLTLPKRPDGKYIVGQMEVSFDPGTSKRESVTVPIEVVYTSAGHGYINAEVAKHIDEIQVAELNGNMQQLIEAGQTQQVQKVAKQIMEVSKKMGPAGAKKTILAQQVLQEINAGGRVTKKTQLALDNEARIGEIPPG
jgi:Ca-activated chloride channel homolog